MFQKPSIANSVDPDQTAPIGAVCSGSLLFASKNSLFCFKVVIIFYRVEGEPYQYSRWATIDPLTRFSRGVDGLDPLSFNWTAHGYLTIFIVQAFAVRAICLFLTIYMP